MRLQAPRLTGPPEAIGRIAGAGAASQAIDAGRVDEQCRGVQFQIDRAGELSALRHSEGAQHAERCFAPQCILGHLEQKARVVRRHLREPVR
ncbi:hypothetical protein D9M72_555470 [compost metagenome]